MLGCLLKPGGEPSLALRRRVALGVELYRSGVASLIVLSGGNPVCGVAEAEVMRALASAAGVPETALLCEPRSRNTAENALCSAALLRERGLRRVALVSHRAHLCRARLMFRLAGLTIVAGAGVPARSAVRAWVIGFYEAAALPRSIVRVLSRR